MPEMKDIVFCKKYNLSSIFHIFFCWLFHVFPSSAESLQMEYIDGISINSCCSSSSFFPHDSLHDPLAIFHDMQLSVNDFPRVFTRQPIANMQSFHVLAAITDNVLFPSVLQHTASTLASPMRTTWAICFTTLISTSCILGWRQTTWRGGGCARCGPILQGPSSQHPREKRWAKNRRGKEHLRSSSFLWRNFIRNDNVSQSVILASNSGSEE